MFNLVFCATAATIVSGSMAERTKFSSYCIYSAVISAVVYPIVTRQDAPNDRRSQLLFPTEKAENLKSSKAEVEAAFYEYLTGVLTQEEAAAFAAALNKLYTASKTESRAGFPHFRNTAGGETARGTTD